MGLKAMHEPHAHMESDIHSLIVELNISSAAVESWMNVRVARPGHAIFGSDAATEHRRGRLRGFGNISIDVSTSAFNRRAVRCSLGHVHPHRAATQSKISETRI